MELTCVVARFASAADFLEAFDRQIAHGGLLVRGVEAAPGTALADCTLEVTLEGAVVAQVPARLASATPGLGVAVLFAEKPAALHALAARLRLAVADQPAAAPGPAEDRDSDAVPETRAGVSYGVPETQAEKMQRALSGDREQRFAMLRDPNKQLHALVLRNPRTSLEEVHWAAKLTTLSPDALKIIAEHPEWGANASVATALVRNPKTPIPIALKLLPRLPPAELKALARSQGRPQLVQAAKKLMLR